MILAAAVAYGVLQYKIFVAEGQAIADNASTIQQLTQTTTSTEAKLKALADARTKDQTAFEKKIASILPEDENYTELTRLFDDYFAQHDTAINPMFQSSLRFGKGSPLEAVPEVSALPISMNVESTRDNFLKFLDFVNETGSLETGSRLMSINSIQLNFPDEGEVIKDPNQKINFTVDMNAYYQTPKVTRPTTP